MHTALSTSNVINSKMEKIDYQSSFLSITSVLILLSCTSDANKKDQKNIIYDNLIFNIALSYPYYHYGGRQFRGTNEDFKTEKQNILQKRQTIKDDSLGIELALHKWTSYGGDCPKHIISVCGENMLFAFPFSDEYLYDVLYSNVTDTLDPNVKQIRDSEILQQVNLSPQLNHILFEKHWTTTKSIAKVDRLITLLADSLLHLYEFKGKDTAEFKKDLLRNIPGGVERIHTCNSAYKKNLDWLAREGVLDNVRIFNTLTGGGAYWKFTIVTEPWNKIKIVATIYNSECLEVICI